MSLSTRDLGPFARVLRIVAWAQSQPRPFTDRQLADAHDMHWQTARVFCDSLIAHGIVCADDSGRMVATLPRREAA